jgi:hypothetical protein
VRGADRRFYIGPDNGLLLLAAETPRPSTGLKEPELTGDGAGIGAGASGRLQNHVRLYTWFKMPTPQQPEWPSTAPAARRCEPPRPL